MEEIRLKDRILEAIDQLRRRKARPDIQRICNFLLRKFSIAWQDTKTDLQKCVDKSIVLKVEYKGSISYRNAAKKFSHLKQQNRDHSPLITYGRPNKRFVALLTNSIAELIVNEPDYVEGGVPGSELIRNILANDDVRYSKKYISILIEKQVEQGGLIRMDNGNFLPGSKIPELCTDREMSLNEMVEDSNFEWERLKKSIKKPQNGRSGHPHPENKSYKNHENNLLRVGSRRKRAKKVFDPSDNNLPKKRGRPVGSLNKATIERHLTKFSDYDWTPEAKNASSNPERGGVCSVCHNNKKNSNDRMVCCGECSNKAHISCLDGGDNMMLKMYPDNTWQCPHCKTCCVCYETSDAGDLTVCSICADSYHSGCHKPPLTEKNKGTAKWVCNNCVMPDSDQLQLQVTRIHPNVGSGDIIRHKLITEDSKSDQELQSSDLSEEDSIDANSLVQSPTPPTLSPQGPLRSNNASPELKCNMSDSQSYKEMDIEDLVDPSIPDAATWTCNEVYDYFLQYFSDEEARVFKDQEIDGRSLLLMKRLDVLNSLKLKLGPALKIYRHVVKLQFRRDDPRLYWI